MLIDQWLDEQEVTRIMRRATQTLRNDRHKRQDMPYSKIGRSVRYSLEDVIKFMENRKVEFKS